MLTAFSFQLVGEALAGHFLRDLFPGVLLGDRGAHLHRQGPLRALRHRDVGLLGLRVFLPEPLEWGPLPGRQATMSPKESMLAVQAAAKARGRGAEGPRGETGTGALLWAPAFTSSGLGPRPRRVAPEDPGAARGGGAEGWEGWASNFKGFKFATLSRSK